MYLNMTGMSGAVGRRPIPIPRVLMHRKGVGVLVNTGGGTLVDMTPSDAAAFWAKPQFGMMPVPGITRPDGTIGPSSGWTSRPGYTQASLPPLPERAGGAVGYMSLSPGMGQPVWSPTLNEFLAQELEGAENVCIGQPGSSSCQRPLSDWVAQSIDFCHNHPDSPGCGNPAAAAAAIAAQLLDYQKRLAAYVANPSSVTGTPYMGTGPGGSSYYPGQIFANSADGYMLNSPGAASPPSNPVRAGGTDIPNAGGPRDRGVTASGPAPVNSGGSSGSAPGNGGGGAAGNANAGGGVMDLATRSVTILGFDIPVWGLVAAGVGGVMLMNAGGRR